MSRKAVIFDVYGTLVHITRPRRVFAEAVTWLVGRCDYTSHQLRDVLMTHQVELEELPALLGVNPGFSPEQLEAWQDALWDELASVRAYPDVVPTLEALKAAGIKTALCSNLAAPYGPAALACLPDGMVDTQAFSYVCGLLKPQPAMYRRVLDELNVAPHEVVMVGDNPVNDHDGPRRVGIRGVHLARNGRGVRDDFVTQLEEVERYV